MGSISDYNTDYKHRYSPPMTMSVTMKRGLGVEFERAAKELDLTPQQLMKYMVLTGLKYVKPPEASVAEWVRGK